MGHELPGVDREGSMPSRAWTVSVAHLVNLVDVLEFNEVFHGLTHPHRTHGHGIGALTSSGCRTTSPVAEAVQDVDVARRCCGPGDLAGPRWCRGRSLMTPFSSVQPRPGPGSITVPPSAGPPPPPARTRHAARLLHDNLGGDVHAGVEPSGDPSTLTVTG